LILFNRDIKTTPVSQIALISGSMRLIDIRMLKEMWKPIFKLATAGTAKNKKLDDVMVDVISKLPHALQMSLFTGTEEAWSTLSPEHMTINPDDIALKHGSSVAGDWMLLGVVDAQPEEDIQKPVHSSRDLENGMLQVLTGIREFFGRPCSAYGITPIAIFRPIRKL
jgi:hypothetical protein